VESHISDIAHVIQLAVAPVFLLTAIATMINAMNTRLGRIVDRRRVIQDRLRDTAKPMHQPAEELEDELRGLQRRSHIIYLGILFLVLSALLVCLVVAGAFVGALIAVDLAETVAVIFILAMLTMITSLGLFLREVYLGVSTGSHIVR
jgi:hypothetical protein